MSVISANDALIIAGGRVGNWCRHQPNNGYRKDDECKCAGRLNC